MLVYLRITDFALLDDVEISLSPGLTVLTGETGAGKSLIIDAVALLRGGRASAEMIRSGSEEARVEAVFAPPPGSIAESALRERLERAGLPAQRIGEEGLVVRRVIGRGGRNRVYLSGQLSTVASLFEICGGLVDLAGQHEHQTLMEVNRHLQILDNSGVPLEQLRQMASCYDRLRAASDSLRAASLDERARVEREEFLRFQLHEIDAAGLAPGEDERLRRERERLRSAERLHRGARRAEEALYSREGAILEEVGVLTRDLLELGQLDPQLQQLACQISEAQALLEDGAHGLRRYADLLSADPERLQEIDDRLHLLSRLLRKHGPDLSAVLHKRLDMEAELNALLAHEERRTAAQVEVESARAAASAVAEVLSASRRQIAERLAEDASLALQDLSMAGARLEPRIEDRVAKEGDDPALVFPGSGPSFGPGAAPGFGPDRRERARSAPSRRLGREGWDRCELLLSSNPGEEPRPLQRIASGGELSRIMLALKRILGQADGVATYVFDEIDAGIGGATADRVGRQIRSLAREKQVLCITHLAQIAAFADNHLFVEKRVADGRTRTIVRCLTLEERREEVARMLGGARVTPRTRAHAEELLREANGVI